MGIPVNVSQNKAALGRVLSIASVLACLDIVNPAAASATGLHAATATVTTAVEYTEADLVAGGVAALAACPRQVRFTTAGTTPSDAPASATIKGWTLAGYKEETVTLAQTATTADSAYCWTRIDSISMPAADGTGATIAIGFTSALGLPAKALGRGASSAVFAIVQELIDGAAAGAAGSLTAPATLGPFGAYTPDATLVPNAARDYIVRYEAAADFAP